jgi:hypothetical protein
MKKFMRIFIRVLIIFLIVSIYFNIGYWSGKSYVNALEKINHYQDLNLFQKFQIQIGHQEISSDMSEIMFIYTVCWPVIMMICLVIVIFKFIFLGEFFRLVASFF